MDVLVGFLSGIGFAVLCTAVGFGLAELTVRIVNRKAGSTTDPAPK